MGGGEWWLLVVADLIVHFSVGYAIKTNNMNQILAAGIFSVFEYEKKKFFI